MQFAARSMAIQEDAGPQLDLDPAQQPIYWTVEAWFAISEPTAIAEPVD